jgi:hypothetical protein
MLDAARDIPLKNGDCCRFADRTYGTASNMAEGRKTEAVLWRNTKKAVWHSSGKSAIMEQKAERKSAMADEPFRKNPVREDIFDRIRRNRIKAG